MFRGIDKFFDVTFTGSEWSHCRIVHQGHFDAV
jgi:hypothetical protein